MICEPVIHHVVLIILHSACDNHLQEVSVAGTSSFGMSGVNSHLLISSDAKRAHEPKLGKQVNAQDCLRWSHVPIFKLSTCLTNVLSMRPVNGRRSEVFFELVTPFRWQ